MAELFFFVLMSCAPDNTCFVFQSSYTNELVCEGTRRRAVAMAEENGLQVHVSKCMVKR